MIYALSFLISFTTCYFIIKFQYLHQHISGDFEFSGPQKIHKEIIPRIGGLAIMMGIYLSYAANKLFKLQDLDIPQIIVLCALPTFSIGLLEDISKKVSIRIRLIFTIISALLIIFLYCGTIQRINIPVINELLAIQFLSVLFTVFAIVGLTNSYNIIDGLNGLASMVGMLSLSAILYISVRESDPQITGMTSLIIFSIFGFIVWNYPKGLLFLGDSGSYLIGFLVSILSIALTTRNTNVSPWFALLLNGYPIVETIFSIYRRRILRGISPGSPDGLHFHTLIFKRVVRKYNADIIEDVSIRNAKSTPYLWALTSICIIPTILFYQSDIIMISFLLIFIILYIWLYRRMVLFKVPKWIFFFRQ
ncbi:glycosyltransferase family 4 protein [Polynucleobacter sp. Nonnen-W13]|uniref:glycosyltransferase family 4 protein n=1 Tax=Polynucleobacter sp. Nonnen-W13 TaxID=1855625 RepID=UPI001C0B2696|nr:glycosyltransferase [Polynucleobacter sp. Nonnen-W13]MBU3558371.1 glycosyltransferase family 4 protein [Polynucleobacter sp. Nonnen-W13]